MGSRLFDVTSPSSSRTASSKASSRWPSAGGRGRGRVPRARLVDPSGRIEARVWNDVDLLDQRFGEGDAVRVLGRVERFGGKLQVQVRTLEAARRRPVHAHADAAAGRRRARRVLRVPLRRDLAPRSCRVVARSCARSPSLVPSRRLREGHHGYAGGLLEHTVGVATLCRETAQLHPRLRHDLLLSAALLHDVGRIRELGRGPAFRRPRRAACSATSTSACA